MLNIAGTAATVAAAGSVGLYLQQYGLGNTVYAATPAEEGCVCCDCGVQC